MEKISKGLGKKILLGVTVAVIGIGSLLASTHSKYTNKITGNGETEIAKWHFTVNGATETASTIHLADTYNPSTLINGKIAPGTSGSFDLVVDSTGSEVGVNYVVDFRNETNKPSNLKFKYKDGNTVRTFNNLEDLETYLKGTINANDTNKTRTLTVSWEWLYETGTATQIPANDKIDTNEGLSALDYSFDVVVTGTQVVPTK